MKKNALLLTTLLYFGINSWAFGNSPTDPYQTFIYLYGIKNETTAVSGWNWGPIYLWVVAFRVGGSDYSVDQNFNISGYPSTQFSNGSHDTINGGQGIVPGQWVQLGWDYTSSISAIETPLGPVPGAVGLITAMLYQADTPNDAVEQGHQVFNQLVTQQIDSFVRNRVIAAKMSGGSANLLAAPTPLEIQQLQSDLQSQIEDTIQNNLNLFQKLGHFLSDKFGSGTEDGFLGFNVQFFPMGSVLPFPFSMYFYPGDLPAPNSQGQWVDSGVPITWHISCGLEVIDQTPVPPSQPNQDGSTPDVEQTDPANAGTMNPQGPTFKHSHSHPKVLRLSPEAGHTTVQPAF